MSLKTITSRENPVYRELLDLATSAQARQRLGRTLLEGEHLLEEALATGLRPRRLVFAEDSTLTARWGERLHEVPALSLPRGLFKRISAVAEPGGLMAVIDIPAAPGTSERAEFIVLLEVVQDPGNLGALIRTAAAAGAEAVHLSRGCAEAWSPKALRGGQGAQFRTPICEQADLLAIAQGFRGTLYAAAPRAAQSLYALDLTGPTAFAFGNEGAGLSPALLAAATPFAIPMHGGVESLNVAASAAVCLFERVRQVAAKKG